jgi:hypothetical protein
MERIHIVGLGPRTGTTLLAESMIAAFDIDAFDEHEARATSLRRNARVYLSKWPGDLPFAGRRLQFDRHFHLICLMRDPRDVVTSRHRMAPERYWAPLWMWKRDLVRARRLIGHPRFRIVRYEELAANPDEVQATIAARLPFLRTRAPFSAFHQHAAPSGRALTALGGLRPIDTASIGKWRQHLPRLAGQLTRHGPITAELIELGYETDDQWLSVLEGVVPDLSPSYWPEAAKLPAKERLQRARSDVRAYTRLAVLMAGRLQGQAIG